MVTGVSAPIVTGVRGTLALVAIDPTTQERTAPELPGVMVFAGSE
jgi:hypothetical protein